MREVRIVTIQVAVAAKSEGDCADAISEVMQYLIHEGKGSIVDWQYLKLGGQFLYGTEKLIPMEANYEEGDAFR